MKQLKRWSLLVGLCLSCCGKVSSDDDPTGSGAGQGNAAGTASDTAGGPPAMVGTPSAGNAGNAGRGGGVSSGGASDDDDPAGGAAGQGDAGTAGETAGGAPGMAGAPSEGGAAGAPEEPCDNDVPIELTRAECGALTPPPVPGGTILEGTYYLSGYDLGHCFFRAYHETLRLTQTAPGTYLAEVVTWLTDRSPSRTNAFLVTSGTTLTLSTACGEAWQPLTYDYSSGSDYLFLTDANGGRRSYQRLAE